MTEMKQYKPGSFCWIELATTDITAAKDFYSKFFGWSLKQTAATMPYTLAQKHDKDIAGMGELMKEQRDQGVPPNWLSYVSVESATETAKRVPSLGGKVLFDAFDVMDYGRMAVLQDPTGAVFAVWEPKEHIGAHYLNEPGTLCWNELLTRNTDQAGRFYTQLFGWTAKTESMGPMPYTMFSNGDTPVAGMMAITDQMGPVPPNWMPYFDVDDCDEKVGLATKLAGRVLVPPMDIPNVGRFATIQDPQGAVFSIIKLKM